MDTRFNFKPVRPRSWITHQINNHWLALVLLGGLVLFQAYSYYRVVPLSLGPRVILQPWLMQQGFVPYEQIADQHSPLMPFLISLFVPLVSDGLRLAKIALVVLLTLSTVFTFWAGKRQGGWLVGIVAVFFFVCWSNVFGFGKLWHESFLTPLYLLFLILYRPSSEKYSLKILVLLGLISGLGILVKQQAFFVCAAFALWSVMTRWRNHRPMAEIIFDHGMIVAVAAIPLILYGIYHYGRAGTLDNLIYWIFSFNVVSNFATLAASPPTFSQIVAFAPAFLLIPAALVHAFQLARVGNTEWEKFGCALILLVASSLGVYPIFANFHLQPILPILAFLSASMLAQVLTVKKKQEGESLDNRSFTVGIAMALALYWTLIGIASYRSIVQTEQPRTIAEYTDLAPVADQIRQRIGQQDCVYVFPDDEATANLYYFLHCTPPRFWVFSYPWYMIDSVRQHVLLTLKQEPPSWVVYPVGRSGVETHAPDIINFIQANYQFDSELNWAQGQVQLLKRRP